MTDLLSAHPEPKDLLSHLHRKMTKRLKKKLLKDPSRYGAKYVRGSVWREFEEKRYAKKGDPEHGFTLEKLY